MTSAIVHPALRRAVNRNDIEQLRGFLEDFHEADIADILQEESTAGACEIVSYLSPDRRAAVFGHLPPFWQEKMVAELSDQDLSGLLKDIDADEGADLLHVIPQERHASILRLVARKTREDLLKLAKHQEGTVGAIMTCDYVTVSAQMTMAEALDNVRKTAPNAEMIYQVYVVDSKHRLNGTISLRELILNLPKAVVKDIMTTELVSIGVFSKQEEAAKMISRYDLLALPVVDDDKHLVGIVTYDDAMDVAEQEATEDMHKAATISPVSNLRHASLLTLYRKRIVWLLVLVFGNLFSGAGIAYFEDTIAAYVVLVFFLPLLVDSGGNAGSQAATLVIRSLATNDIHLKDWGRMLGREIIVALSLGLTMAVAVSLIGFHRGGADIALIVALSMLGCVLVGSLVGLSLPFLLTRIGLDPATASAPLVTTVADAVGVVIYFWIATSILPIPAS
ncbi:MAG: magnesium transporter [Methylicorpusculum sp.]|uniref:magnesium transporter n=1 Tax=Methylicorpusculum sp. TaxID=2713644 RepID=UPI002718E773|nr:magnesium transporter [Methylicorpusculum sp.]MDO8939307.1 magnesium transporter [Methylicorpusculum sp.]MDO9239112.1 magnesium transporter [Methylicorpusculum sp.]MDP2177735.1 magnesium transporter [Methylicorpusculum sp.]MDP2201667.1 magnesium transporter [Methylicorpusculum sp.]MDP3527863.1 magnesium transporter [Methylicorpusculum sp.]